MEEKTLHGEILKLLKEIDRICKKYDITYYAAGGTVIGAVRHKGIIPWDDDADLYMTRKEFYRFREAFKHECPSGRVLGCLDDNEEYPGTIPRYIDETTTVIGKFHCLNTCAAGTIIDIFILDPVGSTEKEQREHIGKLNIYADFVMPYYGYTNRADDAYLHEYYEYKKLADEIGKKEVIKKLENEIFSMDDDACEYYVLRWATVPHVFEKSMFGRPVYFEFEDMQIPVPERWYDYLVQLYGPDWMYIPVHIEDESHNNIVDMDHKYSNYMIDAERFIDKDKALEVYLRRKELFIDREFLTRPLKNLILDANAQYVEYCQLEHLRKNSIDVEEIFAEKHYPQVIEAFEPYLTYQFSRQFIGAMVHADMYRYMNKKWIHLDDKLLFILIFSLLATGQKKRARTLLDLRKNDSELSPDLQILDRTVQDLFDMQKNIYLCRYDQFDRIRNNLSYKELLSAKEQIIYKLIYDLANISAGEAAIKAEELIASSEKNDKTDFELEKVIGDYLLKANNPSVAHKHYEKALIGLTNGLFVLDINAKFADLHSTYDILPAKRKRSRLQEEQFKLLQEVNEICNKLGINYSLFGETLLYAHYEGEFKDEYTTNTLAMTPEAALTFIEHIEKNPITDRFIDYLLNNPLHNGHTIFYGSTDTLSFSWLKAKQSENIGIHITIYILKKKPANYLRWAWVRALDAVHTINARAVDNEFKKNARQAKLITSFIIALIGKKRICRWIFNAYIKQALQAKDGKYYLSKNNYKRSVGKYYDVAYFQKYAPVKLYEGEFMSIHDREALIQETFGKYVKNKIKIRPVQPPLMRLASCDINYAQFAENVDMSPLRSKEWINFKKGTALNPKIKKVNRTVKRYFNILLRSEDRFKLFLKYQPLKDKIIALYDQGNYNELWFLLADYDEKARENIRRGLGLCFDNDIFAIYYDLLRKNGEAELAEKIKNLIPEEHKEPITVME